MDDECLFVDDPLQAYLAELKKIAPLDRKEEIECMRRIRTEDEHAEDARKRLLEANLHMVVTIVERYPCDPARILDLIQKGNCGLLRATQNLHDSSAADDFSGYATPFIEHAIAEASSV